MNSFLRQVASHYCRQQDIPLKAFCFVFPSRRAAAFFRKYIKEVILETPGAKAQFAPDIITVNDFFYRAADVRPTDRIQLLIELHACYQALFPKAEPLDEFIFWGDILLGDFDDIDKYRVQAEELFRNISELKAMQDDFSYLQPEQQKAVKQFVSHFRDTAGALDIDPAADGLKVKERFLSIWNKLYQLYSSFRERLRGKGMAYEGMVYRDLAERLEAGASAVDILGSPDTRRYVFIGLNALNECERLVMGKMRNAGLAEFEWDYVSSMVRDPANKSSVFMEKNLPCFPQAFPLEDDPGHKPEIHVASVSSSIGQAKLLPTILSGCDPDHPIDTAVVLPDETMLEPVLNTIPPEWKKINVTMGYPVGSGAIHTLMTNAANLQLTLRLKDGKWYFYHRPVTALLASSLLRRILTREEEDTIRRVRGGGRYYIPVEELQAGPFLKLLFQAVVTQPKERIPEQIRRIADWQRDVLGFIGRNLTRDDAMLLELDLTKRWFTAVEMLAGREELMGITPAAWFRLEDRIIASQAVPFNGEPLEGLQIMGPLETRALDFRNLVILSANEGVFPRRSVSSSFIPPELRKGFGLPTYEYQDAVWAYYFYRMIQRAEKVWLVYDSRTEGIRSGEESRYIKQLQYHFKLPVQRCLSMPDLRFSQSDLPIEKTPEILGKLDKHALSATTLKAYLDCPAQFYYKFVCRLGKDEEVTENMDGAMIGTVFHEMMQSLYLGGEARAVDFPIFEDGAEQRVKSPLEVITADDLEGLLKKENIQHLRDKIHFLIRNKIKAFEITGRNLVIGEVILEYVRKTLERDLELAKASGSGIRIISMEKEMHWSYCGFKFVGFIDRLDSLEDGTVRVIDYKTGHVEKEDTDITDEKADVIADHLFGPKNAGRPKIAFQLFIYDMIVQSLPKLAGVRIENSIYAPAQLFVNPPESHPVSPRFIERVKEELKHTLDQIKDPSIPFTRTDQRDTCEYCDYKMICGR